MSDLHELSALEVGAAIRRGACSVTEVVRHALDRADALGPGLGAFAVVTPERALDRAAALDADLPPGPLAGVPTAVKDLAATAGVVTARGSAVYAGYVPGVDDDVVGLLAAAGTVSIGKTAVPEFGAPCYTEPVGAPPAVSPWAPDLSAGGSSGGAAAAVAAGILPIAHGTDGGGSIRIPASCCGLVGLKTTRGRVPAGPGPGDPAGLSVHGPLARTTADAAALLDALCGAVSWPGEPFVPAAPPEEGYLAALSVSAARPGPRRRIGLCVASPLPALAAIVGDDVAARASVAEGVDERCRAAAEDTAALLADAGHHVEPVEEPLGPELIDAFVTLWRVLTLADPIDEADEPRLAPLTRYLRDGGRAVGGIGAMRALAVAQAATRRMVAARSGLDAVLTPTVGMLPRPVGWFSGRGPEGGGTTAQSPGDPAVDFARQIAYTPWTAIANLTGEPALGLPVGWPDVDGRTLPVGVTLRGRRGEEALLLALGAEIEQARPWAWRRPPVW